MPFVKGGKGGPGRPKREVEQDYLKAFKNVATPELWDAILDKAARQARAGDPAARKFLADYLVGIPAQKVYLSGDNGNPLQFQEVEIAERVISDEQANQLAHTLIGALANLPSGSGDKTE